MCAWGIAKSWSSDARSLKPHSFRTSIVESGTYFLWWGNNFFFRLDFFFSFHFVEWIFWYAHVILFTLKFFWCGFSWFWPNTFCSWSYGCFSSWVWILHAIEYLILLIFQYIGYLFLWCWGFLCFMYLSIIWTLSHISSHSLKVFVSAVNWTFRLYMSHFL